jgi:hypothetical protein
MHVTRMQQRFQTAELILQQVNSVERFTENILSGREG